MRYNLVLFDLDGTLLDTSQGIFNSVRYAEKNMGFPAIDESQLSLFVGPPPKSMYKKLYGVSEADAIKATQFHREYGKTKAVYEAKIYSGILDLLEHLRAEGIKIGVATLKSQKIAEKVLGIFGILNMFDVVVGMDECESLTKTDSIRMAMEAAGVSNGVVMVGDSQYDMNGAQEAGADFIGVKYGFGFSKDISIPCGLFVESVEALHQILV